MPVSPDTNNASSDLLQKAIGFGLQLPDDLERLAIVRGCRYYDGRNERDQLRRELRFQIKLEDLSNAELAVALLSPELPGSLYRQRLGSALLSSPEVDPTELATLARHEGCADMVRYIAECGQEVEPEERFWDDLLSLLPDMPPPAKPPHITRLIAMTGITRQGVGIVRQWIRPGAPLEMLVP